MKHTSLLLFTVLIFLFPSISLNAQHDHHEDDFDHHHKHHEIALGSSLVYFPEESSWGYGTHLHGMLGITSWLSTGLGYELIVGEHNHHSITGLFHFHPLHPLHINLGPALVFPDEEVSEYRLKFHTELSTVFELGEHLHLGPAIDLGLGSQDFHAALGIHIGWIFD